jgi:hypothetical protein
VPRAPRCPGRRVNLCECWDVNVRERLYAFFGRAVDVAPGESARTPGCPPPPGTED